MIKNILQNAPNLVKHLVYSYVCTKCANLYITLYGRLQTKVAQVIRNGKFIQNALSYLKAFLLQVLLNNMYQGIHTKGHKCYTYALLCKLPWYTFFNNTCNKKGLKITYAVLCKFVIS